MKIIPENIVHKKLKVSFKKNSTLGILSENIDYSKWNSKINEKFS